MMKYGLNNWFLELLDYGIENNNSVVVGKKSGGAGFCFLNLG